MIIFNRNKGFVKCLQRMNHICDLLLDMSDDLDELKDRVSVLECKIGGER